MKAKRAGSQKALRDRAEAAFREKNGRQQEPQVQLSPEQTMKLVHELRVHQVELEMQNEELRRAQTELEISRARFSDLYDLAPMGYVTLNDIGVILEANLTFAAQVGEVRSKLTGKPFASFVCPEDQDIFYLLRKKLLAAGGLQTCDVRIARKDKAVFWAHFEGTSAPDAGGAGLCYLVVSDINERKRLEDALLVKDYAIASSVQAIAFCAIDGNLTYVNKAFLRMWGYEKDTEVTGKPIADFQPSMERLGVVMSAVLRDGSWSGELSGRKRDGPPCDVQVSAHLVRDKNGDPVCMMASFEDITLRRKLVNTRNFLSQCGYRTSGEDFFKSLAVHLAQSLGMDHVCIAELEGDGMTARTVAVYTDGSFKPNVVHALKDTPGGDIVGKSICCFRESVCALFPNDAALRDLKAEGYAGATLWSFDGRPIGLIAVVGRRPLTNPELAEEILKVVTARAAGELERKLIEDDLQKHARKLSSVNDDLTRFNRAMVDRELRMVELKQEVNEVCVRLGEPPRYLPDANNTDDDTKIF